MALGVGLEPTTYRLTADCSAIELSENNLPLITGSIVKTSIHLYRSDLESEVIPIIRHSYSWRRVRDLNPRTDFSIAFLAGRWFKPLTQLSIRLL